jgi:hypothetical protein
MLQKLNKILRYLILIGLIFLVILSLIYKYDSCNKCSFKVNDKKLDTREFMQLYYKKCMVENNTYMNQALKYP